MADDISGGPLTPKKRRELLAENAEVISQAILDLKDNPTARIIITINTHSGDAGGLLSSAYGPPSSRRHTFLHGHELVTRVLTDVLCHFENRDVGLVVFACGACMTQTKAIESWTKLLMEYVSYLIYFLC